MANVGKAVADFLMSKPAITGLLGDKLFVNIVPQKTPYPFATYRRISTVREHHLKGRAGLVKSRIEVSVYSKRESESDAIATAIEESGFVAFRGTQSGFIICGVQLENGPESSIDMSYDGSDEHVYVSSLDFVVNYSEGSD
jgi:hypothetical protein